jgi:hypothetical protein
LEGNERILFSAPFGTGKTYFLKHFFETPEMTAKYNVFHLFPVNYQVASNEDIFELVKYDLLYNMLLEGWIDTTKNDIPKSLAVQSYLMTKSPALLAKMMKCIPSYHIDTAAKASEKITKFFSDFGAYYSEINKGAFDAVQYFVEQMTARKGSIYEMDAISNLIYETLQAHKGNDDAKENVLIIDDLDRIDPEHIFRLLNVFSAHFDLPTEEENKFGFDKVIFVCDVENIRNVFAAKYGQQTDFSGYIDKFYSSNIYTFDNNLEVVENIKRWSQIVFSANNNPSIFIGNYLFDILKIIFQTKCLNLRHFYNMENIEKSAILQYCEKKRTYNDQQVKNIVGIDLIYWLLFVCGGEKGLLVKVITRAEDDNSKISVDKQRLLNHILPILSLDSDSRENLQFERKDLNLLITYSCDEFYESANHQISCNGKDDYSRFRAKHLASILYKAIEVLDKQGLI